MTPRAVILDRDGTLNLEQAGWLTEPDQRTLLPGAAAAVARLNQAGLLVVVATNQSAVARGLLTIEGLAAIHQRLVNLLAEAGARVDAVVCCPHGPGSDCDCRKPRPGLILAAARQLSFAPGEAIMVGDAARDLQAAEAAGCAATVLVRTGKGRATEPQLGPDAATVVVDDLAAAVDWILARCEC
ncbi:MAG: D-glycero-beta-D-manno-heptose 1,7-bisphosphate 7-phosphatase [Armatimonadetes bacterium]|nr:D-glycero-beta-D-manno-heptose 1,7-bisphosphate 7-phosphatase [Armatimonadota bacterium]